MDENICEVCEDDLNEDGACPSCDGIAGDPDYDDNADEEDEEL